MKRIVSVTMVLLLCFAMAVPALAAEQYEFYHAPAVLPEFDRIEGGISFISESCVENGTYVLTIYDGDVYFTSDPFVVEYGSFNEEFGSSAAFFDLMLRLDDNNFIFPCCIMSVPGYGVILGFLGSDGLEADLFPSADYLILERVEPGLCSVITGDMMLGALDQLVSLLPVVLAVIVGCVGLRKAIAWLQDVMRSS